MDDNQNLRDQVAEAIKRTPAKYGRDDNGWPTVDFSLVADAAIKAVLEGMRCGRCRHWCTDKGFVNSEYCDRDIIEYPLDNFGCIHWEQKP